MLPKQARGTSRKHVTKPFTQPAAPDCTVVSVEHDVHERVEHEADGKVGVGVLAVGLEPIV